MKKILLSLLLAFAGSTFAVAQYTDKSTFVRVNAIYIDEVIENFNGDESGEGATVEFAFIFSDDDYFYASLGLEVGYIESDADEKFFEEGTVVLNPPDPAVPYLYDFALSQEMELIPVFLNYTVGGDIEGTGLIWEFGFGIGFTYIDYKESSSELIVIDGVEETNERFSDSDDDIVFSGQVFGRLGYEFTESIALLGGVRYIKTDDADFFGTDYGDLDSVAFDLGLKILF